jgi:serine/threonine protein kinase
MCRYLHHTKNDKGIRFFMTRYSGSLADAIKQRVVLEEQQPVAQEPSSAGKRKKLLPPKIASRTLFTAEQIKLFARDIATGLKFLHKNKIIHRGTTHTHSRSLALALSLCLQSTICVHPKY